MKWYGHFCKTSNAAVRANTQQATTNENSNTVKVTELGTNIMCGANVVMSYVGSTSFYEKDEFSNLIEFRRFNISSVRYLRITNEQLNKGLQNCMLTEIKHSFRIGSIVIYMTHWEETIASKSH